MSPARFSDEQYLLIKKYQEDNRLASEAEALRDLAVCGVYGLFGMSGTIPNLLTVGSHGMAQSWTKTLA